jgi:putative membrane protein
MALAGRPYERAPTLSGSVRPYSPLPLVNACLNGTAFVLLTLGFVAIKRGRRERHELLMKLAFVTSAAFLASYLYYHGVVQRQYGPTKYNGVGLARTAYYALLVTHVVLAVVNLPMALRTFWLAHKERWDAHRRLARITLPIWLYVSITGVIVYLVLYPFNPAP